jgi:hypothetical protein
VASSPGASGLRRVEDDSHQTHLPDPVLRAGRAAWALWLGFLVLALARAAYGFAPTMWGWGFDLLRFTAPVPGWTLWGLATLALMPPFARLGYRGLAALGRQFDRRVTQVYALAAVLGAALAWAFPDRVRFVGDYLLRFGTAERALKPSALFPQALPLDVLLHYQVPRWLDDALKVDVNTSARALGALECALFAALAVAFARALGQRGAFAIATSAIAFFGGHLGMYTGYGKAIAEVSLLTLAVAVFGLRVIREGKGLLPLSLCVATGLVLHRSTLGLLPALALCWTLALRAKDPRLSWSRPAVRVAAGLPLVALAIMLPRIVGTFVTMDPVHFTPPEVTSRGGVLAAMFAGTRPADLLNVVGLLSPLALTLPLGLLALGRWGVHAREGALLASLALPWLVMLLLIHPPQGTFRDWDNFTAAAVAFSLVTAWLVSLAARGARGWAWLCVPAVLGSAAPSLQWLMHNADQLRALERIEAYLREPPERGEGERAKTWDFLGIRYAQLERWERAAHAMSQAAELAPHPRVLLQWALAEQARRNDRTAQRAYRQLLAIAPEETRGWYGLAYVSWRLGDLRECRRAVDALLRLRPGDPQMLRLDEQVRRAEGAAGTPGP